MLPEELELGRYESEQKELEEQLVACELEFETARADVETFRRRYYRLVGVLFAELDKLDAELAQLHLRRSPEDTVRQAQAKAAAEQAERSAREAGTEPCEPALRPEITEDLKQAYRRAVKLLHPDLVLDPSDKERRTQLMAALNEAYRRGDLEEINRLIQQHQDDPAAIRGDDTGARIIRAIRTIAQLRSRIAAIQAELDAVHASEIFQFKRSVEEQEAEGADPLGTLAQKLTTQIQEKRAALASEAAC